MPVDVHAHYVPPSIFEAVESRARDFGLSVIPHPANCTCAFHFDYGLKVRPFFPKLIEAVDRRVEAMEQQGVDRQVLSMWADIFAYGMPRDASRAWHRFLNQHLSQLCQAHDRQFSFLASVPLPHSDDAAAELAEEGIGISLTGQGFNRMLPLRALSLGNGFGFFIQWDHPRSRWAEEDHIPTLGVVAIRNDNLT